MADVGEQKDRPLDFNLPHPFVLSGDKPLPKVSFPHLRHIQVYEGLGQITVGRLSTWPTAI